MQTLWRLEVGRRNLLRTISAWLAIVAIVAPLPSAFAAGAACSSRPAMVERACTGCPHGPSATAPVQQAQKPCCGCVISVPPATAAAEAFTLERPASPSAGFASAPGLAAAALLLVPSLPGASAPDPPDARPAASGLPTILRL